MLACFGLASIALSKVVVLTDYVDVKKQDSGTFLQSQKFYLRNLSNMDLPIALEILSTRYNIKWFTKQRLPPGSSQNILSLFDISIRWGITDSQTYNLNDWQASHRMFTGCQTHGSIYFSKFTNDKFGTIYFGLLCKFFQWKSYVSVKQTV